MNGFDISTISSVYVGSTQYSSIYKGSILIWPINQQLPYDSELEYLQSSSDGGQYIDTNIFPNGNSYASADVLYLDITSADNIGTVSTNRFLLCCLYLSKFHFGCGNAWINTLDVDTQRHTFELSGLGAAKIDGTSYTIWEALTGNTAYSLYIFGKNGTPESKGTSKSFRIYNFKYYENNVLILDLIPVRVGQVGYMYNKVNGQLLGNQGTGNFVLGPDKDLPNGYTKLEYISSTNGGNLYIDLGIKLYEVLNTDYDIAMKFNIASGNANQAALFACQDSDNDPWPGTFVRVNSGAGKVIGRYIGGSAKDNTIGSVGSDLELPVQTAPNKNVTSLNNSNNITHQYGTSLFCAFVGGTNTPDRYCNAKLYYFKLFVNGTLVRDMIPCKNPNNTVGLYDLVNRVFYSSPNGNSFVAGPVVSLNYITDGLIFHLDGINKGTGSDWADLIGGILFNQNGTGCISTSNSWSFPGNSEDYLVSVDDAWTSIGGSDDFTVEVCYNNTSNSARMFLFGFGGNKSSKYPIFYHDGTYITWILGGYTYNAGLMTGNSKNTVSLNNDNGFVNGLQILKTSSTDYWNESATSIRIGSAKFGGAREFPTYGDIYSIRIYSRKLTLEEQLQNQKIDNLRFNLGLSI